MNRKLNDLLDGTTPEELDAFRDDLTASALPPETLTAVKQKTYAKAGIAVRGNNAGQKSRNRRTWLILGAAALCALLVVGTILMLPLLNSDPFTPPESAGSGTGALGTAAGADPETASSDETAAPADTDPGTAPPVVPVVTSRQTGDNPAFLVGSSVSIDVSQSAPPKVEFQTGYFIVRARAAATLPGTYYLPGAGADARPKAFRVIEMQTLSVLKGVNVPPVFLYLMPDYQYVDLSVYTSLLISMNQIGTESFVLRNGSDNRMEALPLPVFADPQHHPELGNMIAFTDGVFDESLWQNKSWLYGYQFARFDLEDPAHSELVVARGDSEQTVIDNIRARGGGGGTGPAVITLDSVPEAAREALSLVAPFENGVFAQSFSWNRDSLIFTRYINGCETDEVITVNLSTGKVTYSESRYSAEDIARAEALSERFAEQVAACAAEIPAPPHTDTQGKTLLSLGLYAWLVKTDGQMHGVIRTAWLYRAEDDWFMQEYDDSYLLYDPDTGDVTAIDRDTLVGLVGKRHIYLKEYGQTEELPQA